MGEEERELTTGKRIDRSGDRNWKPYVTQFIVDMEAFYCRNDPVAKYPEIVKNAVMAYISVYDEEYIRYLKSACTSMYSYRFKTPPDINMIKDAETYMREQGWPRRKPVKQIEQTLTDEEYKDGKKILADLVADMKKKTEGVRNERVSN